MTSMHSRLSLAGLVCALLLQACATVPEDSVQAEVPDPYEGFNRAMFSVNRTLDQNIFRPGIKGYRAVVPEPVRDGISNVARNLTEPWTFVNDLLQGKPGRAGTTLGRFLLNTVFGLGGIFKATDSMGIEYHREDFGQTLAVWGVDQGPYLVLPLLGPSSIRDLTGFTASVFGDPALIAIDRADVEGLQLGWFGVNALVTRNNIHDALNQLYLEDDPYVFARSAYRQRRAFLIRDGKPIVDEDAEDIFDDLDDEDWENPPAPAEDDGSGTRPPE